MGHVIYNGFTIHIRIVSEENRAGLDLELASILVRHDTSATAVHLGGMQIDPDKASVFPSKFSSVSKTSLSSVHSFLVPCHVHPI